MVLTSKETSSVTSARASLTVARTAPTLWLTRTRRPVSLCLGTKSSRQSRVNVPCSTSVYQSLFLIPSQSKAGAVSRIYTPAVSAILSEFSTRCHFLAPIRCQAPMSRLNVACAARPSASRQTVLIALRRIGKIRAQRRPIQTLTSISSQRRRAPRLAENARWI